MLTYENAKFNIHFKAVESFQFGLTLMPHAIPKSDDHVPSILSLLDYFTFKVSSRYRDMNNLRCYE